MDLQRLTTNDLQAQQSNEETTKLRYITPVVINKWNDINKVIMEYYFTDGRISVDEYNVAHRGKPKKVDYLLLYKDNILLALIEAKGLEHSADEGYQQAVEYARLLDVPFAYATNGKDLIEHDMLTGLNRTMKMGDFPTADELWDRYKVEKGITPDIEDIFTYPYYTTASGKKPRYYQRIAVNRTVQEIAKGRNRLLLVMATGTGKTFTAFQIIYRFWKTRKKKKILFIADRNVLVDQTMRNDFKPFADAMVKIENRNFNTSRDIFLGLYQQLKTADVDYYKQLPRDFFDLIVIDECHRGSANADSSWHEILEYFSSATQIGLTATPKDDGLEEAYEAEKDAKDVYEKAKLSRNYTAIQAAQDAYSKAIDARIKAEKNSNIVYFGNPIYTYSLKQGIEDGFLAPYKVISVELDIDKNGYIPPEGTLDMFGQPVPIRLYTQDDFDRSIVVVERRELVAKRISDYMKDNDCRFAKTIVFCEDIPHCEEMVRLLNNENADLVAENPQYIVQITGDKGEDGKKLLEKFQDPTSKYPVIAVTSRLMSTGVDATTCENVVLDRKVGSMTEFKQIIGRGTRVREKFVVDGEEKTKMYFSILDFRRNYLKFNDPAFDGDPVTVTTVPGVNPFPKPPVKPTPPVVPPVHPKGKKARVNGIDVEIVDEFVQYLDENGNLVKENLSSCIRNNIITQYATQDEFKTAWLLAKEKSRLASELLLDIDWTKNFKLQYGYTVDEYDIVCKFGYDIEPPLSKHQRTLSAAIAKYLDQYTDEQRNILNILLDAYVESNFTALKDIKNIFNQKVFVDMGYTPLKIVKSVFGTKEKYFAILNELENKLYE